MVEDAQARDWKPTCVLLDGENKIKPEIKHKT
jgi:aspartate 1-decarboxylase